MAPHTSCWLSLAALQVVSVFAGAIVQNDSAILVNTSYGTLQGMVSPYSDSIDLFRGVPYAAPPVVNYRWKAPTKPQGWSDVRNATVFSPDCMQLNNGAGLWTTGSNNQSEDCLYLNIWTPKSAQELPVYVWYNGGHFANGAGDVITYDGTGLAEEDIIVVTVNSRLGPLGYLAHPTLDAESSHNSSGNYGIQDMQLALEWVYEEISNFGGDPQRITVGGQGSGSACALDMMYSPLSSSMIAGVIAESGIIAPMDPRIQIGATSYRTKDEALSQGEAFLNTYNATSIADLRKLNASAFMAIAADQANATILVGTNYSNVIWFTEPPEFRPNIDGYVLPYTYIDLLQSGYHADVPVLSGSNLNEAGTDLGVNISLSTYQSNFSSVLGDLYDDFIALFPANDSASATNASNTFWQYEARMSAWEYTQVWAKNATSSIWRYFWTHAPPGQALGAFHGSEMYYVFNDLPWNYPDMPWNETDFEIERTMVAYWSNFIKTGNPNGINLTYWPNSTEESTMFLGDSFGAQAIAPQEVMDIIFQWWNSFNPW